MSYLCVLSAGHTDDVLQCGCTEPEAHGGDDPCPSVPPLQRTHYFAWGPHGAHTQAAHSASCDPSPSPPLQIQYHLDRDKNWQLDVALLGKVMEEAAQKCIPRVLVAINPGNPTGQCLPEDNMREIIRFCKDHSLLLLADEVGGLGGSGGRARVAGGGA